MATKRAYNKISEEKETVKKLSAKKTAEKKPAVDEEITKKKEALAFKFIAGELGSTTDMAAKRIKEYGYDPEEIIHMGILILKGEYFSKK